VPKDSPNRIPGLDGLRAISIALVLLGHTIGTRHAPAFTMPEWLHVAELGVGVFFVISGYLITSLLLSERERSGSISLKKFYIRRAYRIFPAAYTYVAFIAVLSFAGLVTLKSHDLLHAVTYTTNYNQDRAWWLGHLWSLSVEEQFYLLWPALMLLLGTRGAMWAAAAAIVIAPASRVAIAVLWKSHNLGIGEYFPTIFDGIATGCLLAGVRPWLSRQQPYLRFLASPAFWIVPIGAVAAMRLCDPLKLQFTILPLIVNTAIAVTIDRMVRHPEKLAGRVLEWTPLVWIGTLSYSLYLWQQPFVNRYADNWFSSFPVHVGLALCAATASHYLVEKPFLRLRVRRAAAAAAPQASRQTA